MLAVGSIERGLGNLRSEGRDFPQTAVIFYYAKFGSFLFTICIYCSLKINPNQLVHLYVVILNLDC